MITKDLKAYADENWQDYRCTVSEASKISDRKGPLVKSDAVVMNFDKISASFYKTEKAPTSADAIRVTDACVELVEFKSGVRQKITRQNFNAEKAGCKYKEGEICEDYWDLFFEHQKSKLSELESNIRFKAVESYLTLEKQVLPRCACRDDRAAIPCRFLVVIDEEGAEVEGMEDILVGLSGTPDTRSNPFAAIRNSLKRLTGLTDFAGRSYFYDEINVLSAAEYRSRLRLHG